MDSRRSWLYTAIAYSLLILVLSFMSTDGLPNIDSDWYDKIFHAFAYTVLMLLWLITANEYGKPRVFLVGVIIFAYGMIIELFQGVLASHRKFDIIDQVANTVGIAIAALLFLLSKRRSVKKI